MSEKKLTADEKRHAFDFIIANALNDKLTNEEFRALLIDTWGKNAEGANAPQSSTHDDKQTADKPIKEKAIGRIKAQSNSVKVNSIDAQACSVCYPRNDRDAHAEALDEHEQLIKQGWEFLRNQMKGNSWVSTYVKLSPRTGN